MHTVRSKNEGDTNRKLSSVFHLRSFDTVFPYAVHISANEFYCCRTLFGIGFFSVVSIPIASSLIQLSIRYSFKCQLTTLKHIKVDCALFLMKATISDDIDTDE